MKKITLFLFLFICFFSLTNIVYAEESTESTEEVTEEAIESTEENTDLVENETSNQENEEIIVDTNNQENTNDNTNEEIIVDTNNQENNNQENNNPVIDETTNEIDNNQNDNLNIKEEKNFITWLHKNVSAQTITTCTAIISMLIACLNLLTRLKKMSKEKATSIQDVCDRVTELLDEKTTEDNKKLILPLVNKVNQHNNVLDKFAKILALSQENSVESRIAILNLIQELGNVDEKVILQTKDNIEEEQKKIEEKKEEVINGLEDIAKGRY